MKRRNWTAEEKMAIVLEGLRGEVSIAEICRVHQISQNQYYIWRDKFFEGGKLYLSGKKSAVKKLTRLRSRNFRGISANRRLPLNCSKKN